MGFEKRKTPEFIIRAAGAEDPYLLRSISSNGGKAAARSKAERKAAALEAKRKEDERLAEERAIFDEVNESILHKDALAHDRAFTPKDD